MEFSAILGRIEMERFIQVESFRKKGNTFRGIPFLSFLPGFPEISVLFVYTYQCQARVGEVQRMNGAIDRMNHYPVDSMVCFQCVLLTLIYWIAIYPVDTIVEPSDNRGLKDRGRLPI